MFEKGKFHFIKCQLKVFTPGRYLWFASQGGAAYNQSIGSRDTQTVRVCVCIRKGIYTEEEKEGEAIFRRTRLCSNAHTHTQQTRHKVVCACVPPLSRYDKQREKSCRAEDMPGRRSNLNKSLPILEKEEELKECLLIHPNNWEQYNSTVEFVKKPERATNLGHFLLALFLNFDLRRRGRENFLSDWNS